MHVSINHVYVYHIYLIYLSIHLSIILFVNLTAFVIYQLSICVSIFLSLI